MPPSSGDPGRGGRSDPLSRVPTPNVSPMPVGARRRERLGRLAAPVALLLAIGAIGSSSGAAASAASGALSFNASLPNDRLHLRERALREMGRRPVRPPRLPLHGRPAERPGGAPGGAGRRHRRLEPGRQRPRQGGRLQPGLHRAVEPGPPGPVDQPVGSRQPARGWRVRLPERRRPGDQHPLRRPAEGGGHGPDVRGRLLQPLRDDAGHFGQRAGLRAVRERPGPRPRRDAHQHVDARRERLVVRVLGREPLRPGQPPVPGHYRADVERRRAHALGGPAAPRRGRRAPVHLPRPDQGGHHVVHDHAVRLLRERQRGRAGRPSPTDRLDDAPRFGGPERHRGHHALRAPEQPSTWHPARP